MRCHHSTVTTAEAAKDETEEYDCDAYDAGCTHSVCGFLKSNIVQIFPMLSVNNYMDQILCGPDRILCGPHRLVSGPDQIIIY